MAKNKKSKWYSDIGGGSFYDVIHQDNICCQDAACSSMGGLPIDSERKKRWKEKEEENRVGVAEVEAKHETDVCVCALV